MRITFSPQAKQDLDEIFDFIVHEDAGAAAVLLQRVRERIASLSELPHQGRAGRVPGTRELVVSKTPFVVPYQVVGRTVEVLRVYHAARRWPVDF